jgi:hypothetical protein
MEIADQIVQKLHVLPPDKQCEVLDFVEFLAQRGALGRPCRDPQGLWADLGIDVSGAEIDEARRELWGAFPRDDV